VRDARFYVWAFFIPKHQELETSRTYKKYGEAIRQRRNLKMIKKFVGVTLIDKEAFNLLEISHAPQTHQRTQCAFDSNKS